MKKKNNNLYILLSRVTLETRPYTTYLVHDTALHSLLLLEHLDPLLQPPLVEQQGGPWVCFVLSCLPLGPRLTL